jgi:hypothetical protein
VSIQQLLLTVGACLLDCFMQSAANACMRAIREDPDWEPTMRSASNEDIWRHTIQVRFESTKSNYSRKKSGQQQGTEAVQSRRRQRRTTLSQRRIEALTKALAREEPPRSKEEQEQLVHVLDFDFVSEDQSEGEGGTKVLKSAPVPFRTEKCERFVRAVDERVRAAHPEMLERQPGRDLVERPISSETAKHMLRQVHGHWALDREWLIAFVWPDPDKRDEFDIPEALTSEALGLYQTPPNVCHRCLVLLACPAAYGRC